MAKPTERRVLTRSDLAKRGLIGVVAVSVLLGLMFLRSTGVFSGPARLEAQVADAGGSLGKNADVKVRGVIVGKVTGIERGPEQGVRVKISIPGETLDTIPANVVARILPATVFGTSFVDLTTNGAANAGTLQAGSVIPADKTQGTLELQQALDDIDVLVKAVGPAELASALGSAAQALKGRGENIGESIDLANEYLRKLNPRLPQARKVLRELVQNIEIAQDVAPELLQATNDGLVAARTIVDQQAALATLLTGGTALAVTGDKFITENQARLVQFIENSAILLNVVHANRQAGITGFTITNQMLNAKLDSVARNGFLNVSASITLNVPPYYTSADCPRYGTAVGKNCSGLARASVGSMLGGGDR